jgi:hypothetical protein
MAHWQDAHHGTQSHNSQLDRRPADAAQHNGRPMDRHAAEVAIRSGIAEIEEAIERLERTCRHGRITQDELEETRDVLELQRERLSARD